MAEAESLGLKAEAAPERWLKLVVRLLAIALGLVFVYAGAIKFIAPTQFAIDITRYHIVGWPIAVRLAFYLPWLELICGLALIIRWLERGALAILGALLVFFIGVSIAAKVRGLDINCGCFGTGAGSLTFTWHLVLDFCLLAAVLFIWVTESRAESKLVRRTP